MLLGEVTSQLHASIGRTHARTRTRTHTFELNEFRPFSTAVGTLLKKEVMVKMFTGSVILSEVWTRKSCVTSDLKAELDSYVIPRLSHVSVRLCMSLFVFMWGLGYHMFLLDVNHMFMLGLVYHFFRFDVYHMSMTSFRTLHLVCLYWTSVYVRPWHTTYVHYLRMATY